VPGSSNGQTRLRGSLEEERGLLAAIARSSSDAIYAQDLSNTITAWNHGAEQIFGYTADEAIGRGLSLIVPPDREAEWQLLVERVLGGVPVKAQETVRVRKDGTRIEVAITLSPIRDGRGSIVGTSVVAREMTELRRAMRERDEEHALLTAFTQNAPIGFAFFDRQFRYRFVNRQLAELNGLPVDAHLGRTVDEIVPSLAEEARKIFQRVIDTGQPVLDHEFTGETAKAPGVTRSWSESWFPVRSHEGQLLGVGAVASEITERKAAEDALRKSEERARALIANLPGGAAFIVDGNLRYLLAEGEALRAAGLTPESFLGRRVSEVLPPAQAAEQERYYRQALNGEPFRLEQQTHGRVFETRGTPLRDASGNVYAALAVSYDITERRQAEAARRASEERLRRVLETDAVGVLFFDSSGAIIDANEVFLKTTGYTRGELERRELTWRRLTPPEWIAASEEQLRRLAATGRIGPYEKEYILADGSRRWMLFAGRDLGDGTIVEYCFDITSQKQMEADLREAMARYEQQLRIFDSVASTTPDFVYLFDRQGRFIYANRRLLDVWGMELSEVIGKTCRELGYEQWHHDMHMREIAQVIATKRPIKGEVPFKAPRTGIFGVYEYIFAPVLGPDGEVEFIAGTTRDVTERKHSEEALRKSQEQFRRLYEANIVGIISADSERIFEANDVFLRMVGYTREDLAAGRLSWRNITPPEFIHLDERGIEELLATGSCGPFEKEYFRKDGSRLPILIGATLLDRDPLKWLCFVVDLTDRKQLERRLFEKQKLESIGLLAGGIAHDFNNLLVPILGNASLAQEMVPDHSAVHQILTEIIDASERAAHLTRQMLAYSGKGQFLVDAVNLSELVEEITRLLHPSIPSHVATHFELAHDIPPVEADASQIQQVVMNLVLNAVEAIGHNAGVITIRTGLRKLNQREIREELNAEIQPGNYVWLDVSDTGCGMDEATMARIFDPFFTTKFTGRGLGLAAVSGIVRGHQGAIKVSSTPGQGTTFLVLFPASTAAGGAEAARAPSNEGLHSTGTILVVDDEEVVVRTATASLERHGYTVMRAGNGLAAIEALELDKDRVSLVLLDLSMPGMSGQEVLPRLREISPQIRVIVSSGYSEVEMMRLFEGQDVAGFIQKPYTAARLAQAVKAAMNRW
jgi:PAS domain S-box-containing protein